MADKMTENSAKILFALITYLCNLNCPHCVAPKKLTHMSSLLFEKTLIKYSRYIRSVALSGGEACLSPFFKEICSIVNKYNFPLAINTNGELFSPEFGDIISKYCPDIFLSFDFPLYSKTTLRIKHPNFDHYLDKIIFNKSHVTLITTVYKSNLTMLPELINWAQRNSLKIKIQPLYLSRNDKLYQKESLWNVEIEKWNEIIGKTIHMDKSISLILQSWKSIYHDYASIPSPKNCLANDNFIIVGPDGERLRCFAHFNKQVRGEFPSCFGEECLFCWDHQTLAKNLKKYSSV